MVTEGTHTKKVIRISFRLHSEMAALNEASVQRKFANVNNTQDSIQSLSLWVLHHKAHHERIVELWFKALKKGNINELRTECTLYSRSR